MKQFDTCALTANFEVTATSLFDVKLTALVGYADGGLRWRIACLRNAAQQLICAHPQPPILCTKMYTGCI